MAIKSARIPIGTNKAVVDKPRGQHTMRPMLSVDHHVRTWRRLAAVSILLVMSGCADGGSKPVTVSGRVLLDGAPLPGGEVLFRPVEGREPLRTVKLDETGAFSVQLPTGEVLVSVDNRALAAKAGRRAAAVRV